MTSDDTSTIILTDFMFLNYLLKSQSSQQTSEIFSQYSTCHIRQSFNLVNKTTVEKYFPGRFSDSY